MTGYQVPERVAYVVRPSAADEGEPTVFLVTLPDGPPVVLHGSAAMIWVLAADGEPDVAAAVGTLVGLAREVVAGDVDRFLGDLLRQGLLAVAPATDSEVG